MNANRKIILIIFGMVSLLTLIIVALVAFSYRNIGFEGAKERAYLTAEIVKNSLTAHMVNGIMDKRETFLEGIERLENVDALWIVRAKSVTEQFGPSIIYDGARDDIDSKVLQSGQEQLKVIETAKTASLRITIPYIASAMDKPNCLMCHQAEEGEVLGAITLKFNIQDDRLTGIFMLLKILAVSIFFLALIVVFIVRMIKPYTSIFDSITDALKRVHEGDYTVRLKEGVFQEDKEASRWLNEIIEKLETVLSGIEKNLIAFVHNRSTNLSNDKLLTAQEIIQDIADIYNFKKTIESDVSKEDIYARLALVIHDHLGVRQFVIFENDLMKNERYTAYKTEGCLPCCELHRGIKDDCRAERTQLVVRSDNFPELCRVATCGENDRGYMCIPFHITDQKSVTISIIYETKEEAKQAAYQIGIIKKYLEESKPILESRLLMNVLRERNFIDGLTGLYNRKYLDEFIDKNLPRSLEEGDTYAIMLLDIDYFKMVNDTYGHDAGDAILQKLSHTMKDSIGEEDFAIRFGGEEFVILMKNPTEESARELADRINKTFESITFTFNNETFSKTVSIGYAFFPADTDQIWRCIKFADLCLYEAKETGRNKVVRFQSKLLKKSEGQDY